MPGSLAEIRVLVTRARSQAGEFCRRLESEGARVTELPTIEIRDPEDWSAADEAIARLGDYGMVIFTSANGVRRFHDRLRHHGLGTGALGSTRVLAIGPATAEALVHVGSGPAVPEEYRAEAVLELASRFLGEAGGRSTDGSVRVLIPRALEAREVLPEGLRELGAQVDVVPVYRTVIPEGSSELLRSALEEGIDCVTFTSSSTVRNFLRLLPGGGREALQGVAVACIGPITGETALSAGFSVAIQPESYTIDGLMQAILDYYRARGK